MRYGKKKALPFYNSPVWRKVRKAVLARDHYLCQICLKRGVLEPAVIVHHIAHLKDRPDKELDEDNLQSVCAACHNRLHPEKGKQQEEPKRRKARVIQARANPEII
jgi:5-methylcytosine-specific restriction enzyme A